ncbi:MAG: 2-C-methyl-D-erythritol 4-phosphate cytidylyltransferase [Candidatus Nanopelagicales bacterium]
MRFGCVITAAGRGERFGGEIPKTFEPLAGTPMLGHALAAIGRHEAVELVVVAAPPHLLADAEAIATAAGLSVPVVVVAGGDTRSASVRAALAAIPTTVEAVLVHDAARPFVPSSVITGVVEAVRAGAVAVVPGIEVVDTVKQIDDRGVVVATPPRERLRAIQTPQGFRTTLLREALALPDDGATDDAGLVERLGWPVLVVPGHADNFKITHPDDRRRAAELLRERRDDVH